MATQTSPKTPKAATPPTKKRRAKGEHDARLNFRINSQQKEKIELAAYRSGQTLSEFAAQTLLARAEEVIEKERVTLLSERDWQSFVEAISNPAPLSESALEMARHMAQYTRRTENGGVEFLPGYVENLPAWAKEGPF